MVRLIAGPEGCDLVDQSRRTAELAMLAQAAADPCSSRLTAYQTASTPTAVAELVQNLTHSGGRRRVQASGYTRISDVFCQSADRTGTSYSTQVDAQAACDTNPACTMICKYKRNPHHQCTT